MASMVSKAMEKFFNTPQEDFTSLIITAISMAELYPGFEKADKERLFWLQDHTHEDLQVSIYKLDRLVDPTKFTGQSDVFEYPVAFKSDFLRDESTNKKIRFKLMSNNIQKYLCDAIREVSQIIYRNFKDFNDERPIPKHNEFEKEESWE